MKSFKEFNRKKNLPVLSWAGHESVRGKYSQIDEILVNTDDYDKKFHDHPNVTPRNLTVAHLHAIGNYAMAKSRDVDDGHGSSSNVNNYLRNKEGAKDVGFIHHSEADVLKSVKTLSSAFTKENTNRDTITTHGGVPKHIGDMLMNRSRSGAFDTKNVGKQYNLPGFTSTSSKKHTAKYFAESYSRAGGHVGEKHMVEYTIHPGSGLSIAKHSEFPENEVLLHHGAKVTYNGTTQSDDPRDGALVLTHSLTVHGPEHHKPLSEYGSYDHPITHP